MGRVLLCSTRPFSSAFAATHPFTIPAARMLLQCAGQLVHDADSSSVLVSVVEGFSDEARLRGCTVKRVITSVAFFSSTHANKSSYLFSHMLPGQQNQRDIS